MLDLIIIGSGPIGLSCGIEATKNKLSHLILEKGCLLNSIYNYPTNMVFFSTSNNLEIGNIPFVSHGDKPTRKEALEYYRRVKMFYDLNVNTYEAVNDIKTNNDFFHVTTNKYSYNCRNLIIATGFYDNPNLLNIPGEELSKVKHYFMDAHPYSEKNVLVIGGGNSAVDAALECYRKDASVTLINIKDDLEPNVKYWVKPDINNRIKEGSIKAYFNSTVKQIHENFVEIITPEGEINLVNDFVLAMTGYSSDFSLLKNAGVEFDENSTPIYNSNNQETNVKNLFLAGVVCGGKNTSNLFIENTRVHAEVIIKDILNKA